MMVSMLEIGVLSSEGIPEDKMFLSGIELLGNSSLLY
jgi:hypothetical protein